MDHRSAYAAALYGMVCIVLFLAPIFIYGSEYSQNTKQKGSLGGSDIIEMISTGMGIHLGLAFIITVALGAVNIIMRGAVAMTPKNGINTFFLNEGGGDVSNFTKNWIAHDWLNDTAVVGSGPLGQSTLEGFGVFMTLTAVVMTLIFIAIPIVVISITIVVGTSKGNQPQENIATKLLSSTMFFVGATLLLYVHSLISSAVVMAVSDVDGFSFYSAMTKVWARLMGMA